MYQSKPDQSAVWLSRGFVALIALAALMVGLSLPTNHDEVQYLSAAHHVAQGAQIYGDFFFSQTPYFPQSLSFVQSLIPDGLISPYIAARLFNTAWAILALSMLAFILFRVSPSRAFSCLLLLLFFSSYTIDLPLRAVRNDMMPLALTLLAFACILISHELHTKNPNARLHFIAGLLISAAVCTKQSYAFVALALALYAFFASAPTFKVRMTKATLPVIYGGLIGAIPAAVTIIPHWENFTYSVLEFHSKNHVFAVFGTENIPWKTWGWQIKKEILVDRSIQFFIIFSAALFLLAVWRGKMQQIISALYKLNMVPFVILCLIAIGLKFISFLMISVIQPQYAAAHLALAAIVLACLTAAYKYQSKASETSRLSNLSLVLIPCIAIIATFSTQLGSLAHIRTMALQDGEGGKGQTHIHRILTGRIWLRDHLTPVRQTLRSALGEQNKGVKIATLMNPYVIEAGLQPYEEFASAPFFYRVNSLLSDEKLSQLKGTSPQNVKNWLTKNKVKATLQGYKSDLEQGFNDYATDNYFHCQQIDLTGAFNTNQATLCLAPELLPQ